MQLDSYSMKTKRDATRRALALSKFREKRKNLSFEKKVRYVSRKKLAENRPRVRGQFVKRNLPAMEVMLAT
ncbi:serine/threonine protein kinase prr1 [Cymbomonas tetramitiformis]|nr:serine/threonine protein kinase prr1 [Cymbomonas tetramitiformis]